MNKKIIIIMGINNYKDLEMNVKKTFTKREEENAIVGYQ